MRNLAFNSKFSDAGFEVDEDVLTPLGSEWLKPADVVDPALGTSAQLADEVPVEDDTPVVFVHAFADLPWTCLGSEITGPQGVALETSGLGRTTSDGIELAQILRDRPDVFNAFFTEFYGPNNDHHSSAWMNRVGGKTPEDYANYWYETRGRYEGYQPGVRSSNLGEDGEFDAGPGYVTGGRTTADGIELAKILYDRPDVFRAFFTEYYGPNNDHHSSAWMNRVGGATPEDYANYWYETYGKYGAYTPSSPPQAPVEASEDGQADEEDSFGDGFAWDGSGQGPSGGAGDDPGAASAPYGDPEPYLDDWAGEPDIVIIAVGLSLVDPLAI